MSSTGAGDKTTTMTASNSAAAAAEGFARPAGLAQALTVARPLSLSSNE